MTTGIEILERDDKLKGHWLLRTAAYLIDYVLIYMIFWVPSIVLFGFFWVFTTTAGVVMFIYCMVMEAHFGGTLGKLILGLRTVSMSEPLDIKKTAMRSLAKIYVPLVLVDTIIGLATEGDPRQRYTDRIAGTMVVETQHLSPASP